jgi:dTDP-4-dehydrorhamnose 3,5-epimerase
MMLVTRLAIPDVVLLEPRVFRDDRGHFYESFNAHDFAEATGVNAAFVQDNQSLSARMVLRGLHYQLAPHAQGKLVRAVTGAVFDVAVDIRRSSATYGRWVGAELSAENRRQLWIPEGFAHGFLALTEGAELHYKATAFYAPGHERCIAWNDPMLGITWPTEGAPQLSPKDGAGMAFEAAETFP